jgi:hypothetical protein
LLVIYTTLISHDARSHEYKYICNIIFLKFYSITISTVSTSSLQLCYCIQMLQYHDIHSIRFLITAVLLYTNAAVSRYPQYPLPHYSSATVYKCCSFTISTVSTSSLQQCYCIQMLQYQDIHSILFFTTAVLRYTNTAVLGYPQYPLPHYSSATVYKCCSIRISTVSTSSLQQCYGIPILNAALHQLCYV